MRKEDPILISKKDYKDFESFLRKYEIIDDQTLWVGGYVARPNRKRKKSIMIFQFKSRLQYLILKDNELLLYKIKRKQFAIHKRTAIDDIAKTRFRLNILFPYLYIKSKRLKIKLSVTLNKPHAVKIHDYIKGYQK